MASRGAYCDAYTDCVATLTVLDAEVARGLVTAEELGQSLLDDGLDRGGGWG